MVVAIAVAVSLGVLFNAGSAVGDTNEASAAAGRELAGRITAGGNHTCALPGDGSVLCWGYGGDGQLGPGNTDSIGDNESPASVGPVELGAGRTATAVTAGNFHTCALLDNGRCALLGFRRLRAARVRQHRQHR